MRTSKRARWILGFGLWCLFGGLLVKAYHSQETGPFFWDFRREHHYFLLLLQARAQQGWTEVLRLLVDSLKYEYTYLPVFPLLPWGMVFGSSRGTFLAAIGMLYGFVAIAGAWLLYRRLGDGARTPAAGPAPAFGMALASAYPLLMLALLPIFWDPILRGLADVLGVGVLSVAILLAIEKPIWRRPVPQLLVLAVLGVGLFLFRRWYAFYIVALWLAVMADLGSEFAAGRESARSLRAAALKLVAPPLALVMSLPFLLPTRFQQIQKILLHDLYAAYRGSNQWLVALYNLRCLSPLYVALAVLGAYTAKKAWGRRGCLICGVYLVAGYLLFKRTQDMDIQHWYGVLPVLCPLIMAGAERVARIRFGRVLAPALLALASFQLFLALTPYDSPLVRAVQPMFCPRLTPPIHRDDLEEFGRLAEFLRGLPGSEPIYVLAASRYFNFDMLGGFFQERGDLEWTRIALTHMLHSRDGFPIRFFRSEWVVTADPLQLDSIPSVSAPMVWLDEKLKDRAFLARFERAKESFRLEGDKRVSVYHLRRAFSQEEITAFAAEYEGWRLAHS